VQAIPSQRKEELQTNGAVEITDKSGWERENRSHFDEIITEYDHLRPNYPEELISAVVDYVGERSRPVALEIGAGTGKATSPILSAGFAVTAVEVGAGMAEFLVQKYAKRIDFAVTVSSFEEAELIDDSYDLVYAASAFHWVDAEVGVPKIFRILRSNGVLALWRYNYTGGGDGTIVAGETIDQAIQHVYDKHFFSYYTAKPHSFTRSTDWYWTPEGIHNGYGFADMSNYGFIDITKLLFSGTKRYTADEYVAFLGTMADHRNLPESNRDLLFQGIKEIINTFGGIYHWHCLFQLYMGRKS
jgi:SAM-dependent methyltransferase